MRAPVRLRNASGNWLSGPAAHARLSALAYVFDLDPLETEIVLICLAPDIDLRYERLYGYLQDDVTRRRPTTDLVAKLLGDGTPAGSRPWKKVRASDDSEALREWSRGGSNP